ncbi:gamma-tubulin complex component 6 [Venturia canescens]|uniref:gamma-tubulin complex component 6 n=1 Tax=Venturia canescens TaxID=32260 RepID=UPI001C9CCFD5|nr:gamma-tubulin complex component 6 [Venturia canescens]
MMHKNNEENDSVYCLTTELCKRFIDQHKSVEHPYLPIKDDSNKIKKIRRRAFEILLKKSSNEFENYSPPDTDPVVELLKYTFVLKTALRRFSEADELENCLDELCTGKENLNDNIYNILRFLNGLKSFETKNENILEIFHYGRPNPLLPQHRASSKEVPQFQVYPLEAFSIPERFDAILGIETGFQLPENNGDNYECVSFGNRFKSTTTIGIDTLSSRDEHTIGSVISTPRYTVRLVSTREFSASPYFMPRIAADEDEENKEYGMDSMGIIPEPEPPWACVKSDRNNDETGSETSDVQSSIVAYDCKNRISEMHIEIWKDIDDLTEIEEHRTWEMLGRCEVSNEPPFITETKEVMLHFERIKQAGYLLLLPPNIVGSLNVITEVETDEFMENIKLLLLGVESSTFLWNDKMGFRIAKNVTVKGLSVKALKSACQEIIHWGECYKSLCKLVQPDPHTGKMQQEGLIFRAMCNSVKELLLYYQAVILRITVDNKDSQGLLKLLKNVRPIGYLITEVARLCRCNDRQTLGEGLGILSHIYEEVTRITRPNVALVFYSILKSCCEVYFRFLQKWLFEGICEDEYGEFMIRIRPQYIREKGHGFWTKAYAINKNSVPGFLANLTESILQCGKTVRLLKICNAKNPITAMFENSHPTVRVCLSVGMVREQELLCREFMSRGDELLGRNFSFSVAFEEQRNAEKERADLVINAQRDTLMRIKRERQETKLEEARNKRELLAQLKDQAEQVATRKEREREAELLKDKQFLDEWNAADEIAKNSLIIEKKNTLDYYNELAAEVERRKIRADWRSRRMKLFEKRANFFIRTKNETEDIEENPAEEVEEQVDNWPDKNLSGDSTVPKESEDVNKNSEDIPDSEEPSSPDPVIEEIESCNETTVKKIQLVPKKSARPCQLNIKKTSHDTTPTKVNKNLEGKSINENLKNTQSERPKELRLGICDNMTDLRRNKLKVLQQEYGMTPNNNEFNIIVLDAEGNKNTISIDASTVENENTRKSLELEKNKNRNRNTRHQTDSWAGEDTAEERIDEFLGDEEKNDNENAMRKSETEKFSNSSKNVKIVELSDAQKNRKRNMAHTYQDSWLDQKNGRVNFVDATTDLEKNRAKVMGHDNRNYRNYENEEQNAGTNNTEVLTPASQGPDCANGITPMSCTTDTFATSTSDSMSQLHNWEDCFMGEAKNASMMNVETPSSDSAYLTNPETPMLNNNFALQDNNSYSKFFGLEAAATPMFESSLTVADVEMIDNTSLQVYLEKSVATPLRVQSRLANAAIVKYLIYDCNILSHLRSLRSFFFLLNGEFAKSLTNSLYTRLYEIAVPLELFKTSTLTNFLEQALNSSLSTTYENSERLSLSAIDIPSQLQVSNPEFLNCICLNYKISWPLNIIIDEKVLKQYSRVFKFLLMVGRVLYVLQEDFHILKVERKTTISSQYHKLQLYRHSMMQFITALHTYLTYSVLHVSWTEFEKQLANATTIDEIYLTHIKYIKNILSRCMLTSRDEKMRTFLCNIFRVILKFHNRVRSQDWTSGSHVYSTANFDRLENLYTTFCECRTYLAHVANKLASSGYQPHLTHFLNALNINSLYDLTMAKKA